MLLATIDELPAIAAAGPPIKPKAPVVNAEDKPKATFCSSLVNLLNDVELAC